MIRILKGLGSNFVLLFALLLSSQLNVLANTLTWHTNENRVTADITSVPLIRVLEGVSQLTGWHVFVESNATLNVSAKFKDLPSGQALRHLLGNLNFAFVPQTNARSRLYVFQSSQKNATLLIQPATLNASSNKSSRLPNELVLTLKSNAQIANLACIEGAQVVGRIEGLKTYRLQFADEAAAARARECLSNNSDVESIDSNFSIERPDSVQPLDSSVAGDINLNLKPSSGDCKIVVAVLDTAGMDRLPANLSPFLLPTINVAGGDAKGTEAPQGELTHGFAMMNTLLRSVQATTSGQTSVKVLPVDIYGNNTSTTTFHVTHGIYQAVNAGANVINLSLASDGDSTVLHKLIRQATAQGVVFFGAAGNQPVTTPVFPAAYPEVIAVTAGDRNGQVASYANRGSFIDIMAPGASVVNFNGQSWVVNGTSAATAYASGIAAGLADASKNCPTAVLPTMKAKLGVNLGQ